MAKKDKMLLNEVQVRKFMKLAALGPLSDGFITENDLTKTEEEELEERSGVSGKDAPPSAGASSRGRGKGEGPGGQITEEDDEDLEERMPTYRDEFEEPEPELEEPSLEEPSLEEPVEEPSGEVTLSDDEVRALVDAMDAAEDVMSKLRAATGEPEEEPGLEPGLTEPELEAEFEPAEREDELEESGFDIVDDDEIVEKVLRRVTGRLVKEAIKN